SSAPGRLAELHRVQFGRAVRQRRDKSTRLRHRAWAGHSPGSNYAFEGALHVLSVGGNGQEHGIIQWNSLELWRTEYADMAEGCLFFAEDVFGNEFCLRDGRVFTLNAEIGQLEMIADTMDAWAGESLTIMNS